MATSHRVPPSRSSNLILFLDRDINTLYRHLSGTTTHRFNLADPLDHAAFLNLVQHHGFPTPLLDWTFSPFIAAYFAFKSATTARRRDKVRIFVLDQAPWKSDWQRSQVLVPGFLHMTLIEPSP
jgi:hypothetical protein